VPSGITVYRDSYISLKKTLALFRDFPHLALYVRRLWFNGCYVAETSRYIFDIIKHCQNLQSVTLPWTTVRHGDVSDWLAVLGEGNGRGLHNLEFLSNDLKTSQTLSPPTQVDHEALGDSKLDFSGLTRLKVFGNTTFKPICDADLAVMARTATNLEEVHVTGTDAVTIDGILSLLLASSATIRVLEYSPRSAGGFEHPAPSQSEVLADYHICSLLAKCPHLDDLTISLPSICPDFFATDGPVYSGDLQVRIAGICTHDVQEVVTDMRHERNRIALQDTLHQARALIETRDQCGDDLDIEILTSNYIFEPRQSMVHGNFQLAELATEGHWPGVQLPSGKGPYGQSGLYGKEEAPYTCISERRYMEGLEHGYINF
jgi:hypothetical protein